MLRAWGLQSKLQALPPLQMNQSIIDAHMAEQEGFRGDLYGGSGSLLRNMRLGLYWHEGPLDPVQLLAEEAAGEEGRDGGSRSMSVHPSGTGW